MPGNRNKRRADFDPNKSDSADSTYSASASRAVRNKGPQHLIRKPPRKKQRRTYGDGSEDNTDEEDLGEDSFEEEIEEEEEEIEIDQRTGRPKRQSAKRFVKYEESDEESANLNLEEEIEDVEEQRAKPKKTKMIVKLNLGTPRQTPAPSSRSTRVRSGSHGARRGLTPEAIGTRRSTRIAHDPHDPIVALTDSGRHAEIIQPATHNPPRTSSRPMHGGKGVRPSAASVILEEQEESLTMKRRPEEGLDNHSRDDDGGTIRPVAEEKLPGTKFVAGKFELGDSQVDPDVDEDDELVVPESPGRRSHHVEDEDDDEGPVSRGRRGGQRSAETRLSSASAVRPRNKKRDSHRRQSHPTGGDRRSTRRSGRHPKGGQEESSDFEPNPEEGGEDELSSSGASESSRRKGGQRTEDDDESSNGRRSRRISKGKGRASPIGGPDHDSGDAESEVAEELAEELEELKSSRPRRELRPEIIFDKPKLRGRTGKVDYRIINPDIAFPVEEADPGPNVSPPRRGRGGGVGAWQRSLFSTYGPFGGAGGPPPVFGGPGGIGAAGGVDSDSSDDDNVQRPHPVGGTLGMTPTSAVPPNTFPSVQMHGADPVQGLSGTPANLGRIKDKQALADADPLGVDQSVNFDSVGGLQNHINHLKEMVSLPLLYPEIFTRFHVTPPRGVLFHGPPGTGKTLLARALASSVSSHGRKVSFYMRKGADALSKWVGEAERQLRLLFEEARKTQPSIIFFDEIDGLAPVRSSKQDQIHASLVSTLLALMDGMDGRGQVIVIGATNRPDSIDPALRRPGRFDREFYFPLPNTEARRSILDIHTKGWDPALPHTFKDQLAGLTKGYGGADLRALCTEAALNAVQRRYPQIYTSNEKLLIDPTTINISPKDFMLSIKELVPSSERSTSSGAAPLPQPIEPLLRDQLVRIKSALADVLPQKKTLTALEEAQFEDSQNDGDFQREKMQQEFERSRIFRPRLLIEGPPGMGQQYLASAILNHFEGLHVQSFDLPTLLSDSTKTPEGAVVQLFAEVRRHKPSVIYIPNVNTWYQMVAPIVVKTLLGLLRSLTSTEPVLVLGVSEIDSNLTESQMMRDLFGYSRKNRYYIERPDSSCRKEYFKTIIEYIETSPDGFPDPINRKKRKFEQLKLAPPPPEALEEPSKDQLKAQKKKDRHTLNLLKIAIQPIMDQIRQKHKKFRTGVIDDSSIKYLYDEDDPNIVSTDLPLEQRQQLLFRPYEKALDDSGVPGLLEVSTNKFYYNLETVTIEKRLSNGYYKRPKDFLADIKRLAKDSKQCGDQDRTLKANEMLANVEVDIEFIEQQQPALVAECQNVSIREVKREKLKQEKARKEAAAQEHFGTQVVSTAPLGSSTIDSEQQSSGPVVLGESVPGPRALLPITPVRPSHHSSLTNGDSGLPSIASNVAEAGSHSVQSNGFSVPSHGDGEVHMADVDDGPATQQDTQYSGFYPPTQPSQETQSSQSQEDYPHSQRREQPTRGWPIQSRATTQPSQKSALTVIPPGFSAEDLHNSASTTTSGKKTSDNSNRSSGPYFNTQSSSSVGLRNDVPDFSGLVKGRSESQLPDTQEMPSSQSSNTNSSQSQPRSQPGSQPPVPAFDAPPRQDIKSILNNPALVLDRPSIGKLHEDLASRTSDCSVEQLEQINTALMDCIWKMRGEWDRNKVRDAVEEAFEDVLSDIEEMQMTLVGTGDST
ncbi:MAG: hypothetical protein M1835_001382 [Candelina submexicana]|nr:MAG: hypothetical protein M1835_001382 [Candelina submexicana]